MGILPIVSAGFSLLSRSLLFSPMHLPNVLIDKTNTSPSQKNKKIKKAFGAHFTEAHDVQLRGARTDRQVFVLPGAYQELSPVKKN